jgi:hypothetical protein
MKGAIPRAVGPSSYPWSSSSTRHARLFAGGEVTERGDAISALSHRHLKEEEIVMAKAKSRSTSLPEDLDLRVRTIALRENRTSANVLENAVRVFTLLPQELRNLLIENSADQIRAGGRLRI